MATQTNKGLGEGRNQRYSHGSQCNHSCMLYGLDRSPSDVISSDPSVRQGEGAGGGGGMGRGR